ncbi:isopenicillin N synthase family oxygenase [Phaeobacter sp. CNT1-3]|jgi:isopenicillin N synthase-like dioxygenase|nr:isopenicillin N synthase family oxygenase [Phaeobacter sp. CNT1-3]
MTIKTLNSVHYEDGTLPLISLQGLTSKDPEQQQEVADQIGQAARQFGFFRISDHGISPVLIEAAYSVAALFFAQPERHKMRHYIANSTNHRGYVPFTEKGDYEDEKHRQYEAFDLGLDLPMDDPDYLAGNRLLGPNVWPDSPGFQPVINAYYQQISALGRLVTKALEMHLRLPEGTMSSKMDKPISQLRLLHYLRASAQTDQKSVNMGAHTDYECLTLLHTRNPGLQVLSTKGKWIDVPVDHSVFVCNIGDMLEAWSNGILRSTLHRVLNSSDERFSMPYFVAANYDTMIEPFPELCDADRPAAYKPFLAGEHLETMLTRDFPYLRKELGANGGQAPVTNPFENHLQSKEH